MGIDSPTLVKNTPSTLRPLGFGELLDTTFSLYRTNFLRFLAIASIYFIVMIIGSSISLFSDSVGRNEWIVIRTLTLGIMLGFSVIVVSGLVTATSQIYLDGELRTDVALKRGIRRFFPCFFGLLVYGLLTIITLILYSIPLGALFGTIQTDYLFVFVFRLFTFSISLLVIAYFATYWCLFAAAILIEEKSIRDAIKRRRELVIQKSFQIVGTMTAIFLLFLAIGFIFRFSLSYLLTFTGLINLTDLAKSILFIQLPIIQGGLSLSNIVLHLINLSVDTITMPIWVIGFTLLYFNQRIRREGFDIEMMAEHQ